MSLFSFFSRESDYNAELVTGPLTVDRFISRQDTPGNVGVCLSGGGTRACMSGMGQLRALQHLQVNGRSLLSQTKALSTVSGGSWAGVPWTFLQGTTTDEDFLNRYVEPGDLVPSNGPVGAALDSLPPGNLGNSIASELFSTPALAVAALIYAKILRVPEDILWQTLIGLHLLKPYGLYSPGKKHYSTSSFTQDMASLQGVIKANPSLEDHSFHLVA
ncbi:MAG: hypothetical protein O3A00_19375, partial [Planctomycetota bacterium]|nr:hypothetical protein [Planctomycetota bacterium]